MNYLESGDETLDIKSLPPPLTPSRPDTPHSVSADAAKVAWNSGSDAFAVKQKPGNAWGTNNGKSGAAKLFPEAPNTKPTQSQGKEIDWSVGPVSSNDWGAVKEVPATGEWVKVEETAEEKEKARFDKAMKGWPWSGNPPQMKTIVGNSTNTVRAVFTDRIQGSMGIEWPPLEFAKCE